MPAVTHVDYLGARPDGRRASWALSPLARALRAITGCPVVVNTSFNLSWEPIVNQPSEAYRTFLSSDIDALVLENALLLKIGNPPT